MFALLVGSRLEVHDSDSLHFSIGGDRRCQLHVLNLRHPDRYGDVELATCSPFQFMPESPCPAFRSRTRRFSHCVQPHRMRSQAGDPKHASRNVTELSATVSGNSARQPPLSTAERRHTFQNPRAAGDRSPLKCVAVAIVTGDCRS